MPPSTVRGKVMSAQMTMMMTIVPNGSAAVDCEAIGTSRMVWKMLWAPWKDSREAIMQQLHEGAPCPIHYLTL